MIIKLLFVSIFLNNIIAFYDIINNLFFHYYISDIQKIKIKYCSSKFIENKISFSLLLINVLHDL